MIKLRLLVLILVGPLFGFSDPASFHRPTNYGGGGGYTFTGSPSNHGMNCAECHESIRQPKVSLTSDPPGLFESGYQANTRYRVQVALLFETRGLEHNGQCAQGSAACNRNLFVAEFVDLTGQSSGVLCPDVDPILSDSCETDQGDYTSLSPGGKSVAGQSLEHPEICNEASTEADECIDIQKLNEDGLTASEISDYVLSKVKGRDLWEFSWRSPSVGASPVRFYMGLVDGDGGTRIDTDYTDYYGDSVSMHALLIPRSDTISSGALSESNDGCSSPQSVSNIFMIFTALILVRRRQLL